MKNFKPLLSFFFLALLLSCSNENIDSIENKKIDAKLLSQIELNTLEELQLTMPEVFGKRNVSVEKTEPIVIDDVTYIRTYFDNGYVSTMFLELKEELQIEGEIHISDIKATTKCISSACASGGGCLPVPGTKYCSECTLGEKDCTRSTSNGVPGF